MAWQIDDADALHLCRLATQAVPFYVRASNRISMLVHLDIRGAAPWAVDVDGSRLVSRLADAAADPDVVVSGPPWVFALLFYARAPFDELLLAGLRVERGRRPDLAPMLTEILEAP